MINGQLELSLTKARGCRPLSARQRRLSRARWWFERMRQTVESALDWQPTPPGRPEQTWFPNACRQVPGAPTVTPTPAPRPPKHEESQLCE